MDGDKCVYGHNQLEELLQLNLHYNYLGGFDKYLSNLEDMCQKLEERGKGISDDQQHNFLLHGIKDEDNTGVKDSCDKKYFQETILELCYKAIKLVKYSGIKKNKRQSNAAINTSDADATITVNKFPPETWNTISKDVKKWVNEIREAFEAGKHVVIKYGSQYINNQKANKQANNQTKKKKNQYEALDMKKYADTTDGD